MGRMREQAVKHGARMMTDDVVGVDLKNHPFTLATSGGETLRAEALIVASGVALVLRPGAQVGWFGALIWVIGPLLILAAVAAAVLLWPGIGRPSLPPPAARGDDAEATVVLRPAATPPRPAGPPPPTARPGDFNPFG